jgi:hypothetical protein
MTPIGLEGAIAHRLETESAGSSLAAASVQRVWGPRAGMVPRQGRLIRQHRAPVEIEFSEERGIEPAFLELHALSGLPEPDEVVVLERQDGRIYHCRALADRTTCVVLKTQEFGPQRDPW